MDILKIFRRKPVVRYEDIIGYEYETPKGLRKLRFIWFLARHPDERQRYYRNFEKWMVRRVGAYFYTECLVNPQGKLHGLLNEAYNLRKEIRDLQRYKKELLATLDVLKRIAREKEATL
jgi:hypothetical protein